MKALKQFHNWVQPHRMEGFSELDWFQDMDSYEQRLKNCSSLVWFFTDINVFQDLDVFCIAYIYIYAGRLPGVGK